MDNFPDKPVNLPGIAKDLPQFEDYTSSALSADVEIGKPAISNMSADELFANINAPVTASKNVALSDIYTGDRYAYSFPYRDTEEMYAQQQSRTDKWKNGFLKMTGTATSTFLSGTVGTVYGIGSWIESGKFSSFYDNDVNRRLDEFNKKMEDWLPNYYKQSEKDAAWWSSDNILTANFWADKVVKNLGFSIGTMAGGFAWGAAIKSLGIINALTRAGKGLQMVEAVEKAVANAPKAQRFGAIQQALTSLSTKYLKPTMGNILNNAERGIVSATGTFGEASLEALNNSNEFRNKMIAEYKSQYGIEPTGADLEEINQYANSVGNYTWGMNALLLTATNYIQLPKILNSSKTAEKRMMNNIVKENVEKGASVSQKVGAKYVGAKPILEQALGKPGRFIDKYLWKPSKLLLAPVEGIEEGMQYAVQVGTQDFFDRAYKNKEQTDGFWKELGDVYKNVLTKGVVETVTSNEGMEQVLIGMISGGIQTSFSPFGNNTVKERGLTGQGGYRGKNTKIALDAINKSKNLTQVLQDGKNFVNIAVNSQINRQVSIVNNDTLLEKDYEKDYTLSYIIPRVKYGKLSAIEEELKLYEQQASTEEGFNALKVEGVVLENEKREQFLGRLANIRNTANETASVYEMLEDKYSAILDKDGKKRVYSDEVIDKMAYSLMKIKDYDQRLLGLSSRLSEGMVNFNPVREAIEKSEGWKTNDINKILEDKNVDNAITKALSDINSSLGPDISEKTKADLLDFADMLVNRNAFIKEYEDFKNSPEKHSSKPLKPVVDENEDDDSKEEAPKKYVRIKTKSGEFDYQIGKTYFVGEGADFTTDNLFSPIDVYDLIILGENEDGSIKIKDQNGKIRDISKDALSKFKLGDKDILSKNKTANFYYEHRNDVYEYNFGKKWGGKKTGRLKYENGKLYFVYINSKGKLIQVNVNDNKYFKPQGEFKEARLTRVGKTLKTQKQELAEKEFLDQTSSETDSSEIRNQAREVLAELNNTLTKEQEELSSILDKKKKEIANIEEELKELKKKIEDISDYKDGRSKTLLRFKPSVRNLISHIKRLEALKESIEFSITGLSSQIEDVEFTISYVQDYSQNINELPLEDSDFFEELQNQVLNLEIYQESASKEIGILNKVADKAKDAIDSAVDFLSSLINDFEKRYPKVPLAFGKEWVEFLNTNPNFLRKKPEYKSELKQLEEMIAQVEDIEITANEDKIKDALEKIASLHSSIEEAGKEHRAKKIILDKFLEFREKYETLKKEEEKVKHDEQFRKDFLGTQSLNNTVHTLNENESPDFEPSKKKSIELIWRATIGINRGKNHQERANRFGARFPKMENKSSIKGVYVTKNNQHLLANGLTEFISKQADKDIDEEKIIALVMVDDSGETPVLVDEFGKPLEGDQLNNIFDHIIFQVFPLEEMKWSEDFDNDSMFRKNTPKEDVDEVKEHYGKFRERVLKLTSLEVHSIEASFGIPDYEKTEDGKVNIEIRNSVQSTGLITEDELFGGSVIFIPTLNEVVSKGTTTYEVPIGGMKSNLGRPFADTPNGRVPLQNRRHTEQEANNIFNAILKLAKNRIASKDGLKTDESKSLFAYLRSVTYWGVPLTQEGKRKEDGYNSLYLDEDLETKEFSLFVSGKGKRFVFTPSNLEDNKANIIALLNGMYMNINSSMVNKYDEPYDEIISIDNEGNVKKRTWINYQAFLLSETYLLRDRNDGENGKKRNNIPLTTTMRQIKNDEDVNRKGIYFYTSDNSDEITITDKKKKKQEAPPKIVTPTGKKTSSALSSQPPAKREKNTPYIFTGKLGRKVKYEINDKGNVVLLDGEDLELVLKDTRINFLKSGKFEQSGEAFVFDEEQLSKEDGEKLNQLARDTVASAIQEYISKNQPEPVVASKTTEEEIEIEEDDESFTIPSSEDELDDEVDDIFNNISENRDDEEYRRIVENELKGVSIENWEEVEKWLKKNFPLLPVYRVKRIIETTNGGQAWGMFKNGALYIYENAEVGTVYHEVFEAVWKMFTPEAEQSSIISEFKNRSGSFVDRVSGKTISYKDANAKQIKEQLAEEFRDYILFKKIPNKPSSGKPFILKLFSDLLSFIKAFIKGKNVESNVETLFKNINEGKFAKIQYEDKLSLATSGIIDIEEVESEGGEFRERILSDREVYQLLQSMTHWTLIDKLKEDRGLFEDVGVRKEDLYHSLKSKIIEDVGRIVVEAKRMLQENKITKEQFKQIEDSKKSLAKAIWKEWPELVIRHEEYLKSYSIEFDENDELQLTNEDKVRESDFLDANKIDHLRKANKAIKLLLSTIPEVNEDGSLKRSEVGGATLIPMSKVAITIMNNVYNATSTIDMFEKLRMLAETNPNYRKLYKRLIKKEYYEKAVDFSNISTVHGERLISSFWKTFKKQNPEVLNIYIFDNGDVAVGDANLSTIAGQMREILIASIISKAREGSDYLKYDKESKSFKGTVPAGRKIVLDSLDSYVSFLSKIGININIKDFKKLKNYEIDKFKSAVDGIYKSISENEGIVTFSGKTLNINNKLLDLGYIQARMENPDADSTFFNISGERTQSYIGTNPASDLHDFLSQLENFSLPEIERKNSHYSYLFTDVFSKGSVILKKMFTPNGKKIRNSETDRLLHPVYIGGIDNKSKGKVKESSKLSQRERYIQEINLNLKGYYLNLVPGDASMEWAMFMGLFVKRSNKIKQTEDAQHIFKDYFIDDFNLAKENRPVTKGRKSGDMRFFLPILGEELHSQIMKYNDADKAYLENESRIKAAIVKYVAEKDERFKRELYSYGVIKNDEEGWTFDNIDVPSNLSEDEMNSVLNFLNLNFIIANIELHKIIYSDPYQYEDELKRTKNMNSPAQAIVHNSPESNSLYTNVYNKGYDKEDIGWINFNREFFRTATYTDVLSFIPTLNKYDTPYKETDGQGIISLAAHKQFKIRGGDWTDANELQYRYDIAWEKKHKGDLEKKAGNTSSAKKWYDSLSLEEIEILDRGNPQVKSTYTPVKPIARGNKRHNESFNNIVLDKYSLYPMSYRLLHDIASNGGQDSSNAILLYNRMQEDGIDYIVFDSGRKVGAVNSIPLYITDGKFNNSPIKEENVVNVSFHTLSFQAEVPSKDVAEVTRGTQMTKLATMDYLQAGVPIDFLPEKNFTTRYKEWNKLSKEDKITNSEVHKEIVNNQKLLDALTNIGYKELLASIGVKETSKGFVVTDMSLVSQTLREELLKRETNNNITKALDNFIKGYSVIEATPAYQQIRHILYSIADKRVISQKMPGGMKVQVASTLLESVRATSKEVDGKQVYTSDLLGFYEKDGKRVCQLMVGRWFESDKTDEELLKWFNETEEGQKQLEALAGVAFRIPTQNKNSIESFVIERFLPKEFGDAVIVPSAIVNKAGSDFDIDKLTIYLKNVKVGKDGYPRLIEMLDDGNSTAKERYYKWIKSIVPTQVANYIRFLSTSEKKALNQRVKERLAEINEKYSININTINDIEYQNFVDSFGREKSKTYEEQEELLNNLFISGKALFNILEENQKQAFWDFEDTVKHLKGPAKVMRYYLAVKEVIEGTENIPQKYIEILSQMLENYKLVLNIYGLTDEKINNIYDRALTSFRESKSDMIGTLNESIQLEREAFLEAKNEEEIELHYQEAVEMADISGLITFDEFQRQQVEDQNTKKALQNAYISSLQRLTSNSLHFDKLVSPNSAETLKKLSGEVVKLRGQKPFNYKNVGNLLDRVFMSHLRHAFVTGKQAIGIAAVNQTNHSINQRQLVYIDANRLELLESENDKKWLDDCSIKFEKFNTIEKDGKIVPTLSFIKNTTGEYISDIIGMFIDGYVDISKGPWIMELGATPDVTSTWLFLIKLGVPVNTVAYFMNQPIIRDYLKSIERAGYKYLFMEDFIQDSLSDYPTDADLQSERVNFTIPSNNNLKSTIGKKAESMSTEEKLQQQLMLLEFIKYAKLSEQMFHVTQGMNADTATLNDPLLIFKKTKQLEKARKTVISNVDEMINNSFVSTIIKRMLDMRDAISKFLPSDRGVARNIVETVLEPYVNMPDREFLKLAHKVVTDLFDYAIHVDGKKNEDLRRILIENGGATKKIMKWVNKVKQDKTHPMHGNHVVNILQEVPSKKANDENDAKNIKIKALGNKTFDQNNIIFAFKELKDYLKASGGEQFYNDIVLLSVLQSGLSNSSISFTSLVPYEDFVKIYNPLLSKLSSLPNIRGFLTMDAFYRNNWTNDDVIPYKKAPLFKSKKTGKPIYNPAMKYLDDKIKTAVNKKIIPQVMKQDVIERTSNMRFMVYTWEKYGELVTEAYREKFKNLSGSALIRAIKNDMRSKGDYSFINKGLFKRVEYNDGTPYLTSREATINGEKVQIEQYVYKAINAWGDSYRAKEFYDVDKPSLFDNGFMKVEDVDNNVIIDLFENTTTSSSKQKENINTFATNDGKVILKEGTFKYSEVSSKMLEAMGYSPNEIGEILKKICK